MSDDRRCFGSVSFDSPGDGPFCDDQNAHVSESAEEEDLLRQPLENEFNIVFEVNSVQKFHKDGYVIK